MALEQPRDPESRLNAILTRHRALAHEIDSIPNERDRAEARQLLQQIAPKRSEAAERDRQRLLVEAPARLARWRAERMREMPERRRRFREAQVARVRRALAESRGVKAVARRLTGMAETTWRKWFAVVQGEDAARPVPRCPLCAHELPSLDAPPKP